MSVSIAASGKAVRKLQAERAAVARKAREIHDKASAENRDLTVDEKKSFDEHMAKAGDLGTRVEREQALMAEEASAGIELKDPESVQVGDPNILKDAKRGFRGFGEFARAVKAAAVSPRSLDERLVIGAAAPSPVGNEAAGADGGFVIPPQFASEIFTYSLTEDSLLPFCDDYDVQSNSMVFPKDETVPWGTDGIRAYWQAEAGVVTATKPKLGTSTLRMHKLMALVPLTDELIEDDGVLGKYLTRKVGDSIRWKTNEGVLFGSGAGQPLGALNGAAALIQAKDSGQATQTLSTSNVANMISRLPPGSFPRAIWLINNATLPSLFTLTLGNYPIYLPTSDGAKGGAQTNPYGTLLGRPIIVSQHAAGFSSQGDVILLDLSYYRVIKKAAGLETATSMHLYFDADATAFRTTFRIDGQPIVSKAISPAKGNTTMSPFVQLAAR